MQYMCLISVTFLRPKYPNRNHVHQESKNPNHDSQDRSLQIWGTWNPCPKGPASPKTRITSRHCKLFSIWVPGTLRVTLRLQIAQSRSYLHTLGPKVGTIYILGALGLGLAPGSKNLMLGPTLHDFLTVFTWVPGLQKTATKIPLFLTSFLPGLPAKALSASLICI